VLFGPDDALLDQVGAAGDTTGGRETLPEKSALIFAQPGRN